MVLIWSPYFLFIPVLVFIVMLFHRFPGKGLLYVVFSANKNEIYEFIAGIWQAKILVVLYLGSLVFVTVGKEKIPLTFTKRSKNKIVILLIFLYLISGTFKSVQKQRFMFLEKEVGVKTLKETPLFLVIKLVKMTRYISNTKKGKNIPTCQLESSREINTNKEIYILVIGESSRYKNWHINGYGRPTSPGMDTLSNLVSIDHAYSNSFLTKKSVPEMLAGFIDDDSASKYSLIDFFNSQDFYTAWITVQTNFPNKLFDIAYRSDTVISIFSKKQYAYDERLNDQLKLILNEKHPRLFVVLHQIGSHYPYYFRYPETFNVFKPSLSTNSHFIKSSKRKEELINSYDNSVLYTDYNLSKTIGLIKEQECVSTLVYCSDHGDNLFDGDRQYIGRGFNKVSTELFHVPMFVWYSNEYLVEHKEIVFYLNQNQRMKFSTSNVFESFLGMSGYVLTEKQMEKNIFGDKYLPSVVEVPIRD